MPSNTILKEVKMNNETCHFLDKINISIAILTKNYSHQNTLNQTLTEPMILINKIED